MILYRSPEGLIATSLPTPIPIKIGTYLDYTEQLGHPWENEGVDIEAFRRMPARQRYGYDRRLLYTYRGLGQVNPLHAALGGRQVLVVLTGYASAEEPISAPLQVADPMARLWPHVRFDWVFDPALNTHHLPRTERDRGTYRRDSHNRLTELAAEARIVVWRHHGRLRPLLNWLDDNPGGRP